MNVLDWDIYIFLRDEFLWVMRLKDQQADSPFPKIYISNRKRSDDNKQRMLIELYFPSQFFVGVLLSLFLKK